ncbi:unnamed protein product [Ectocarpus sp. 12 AP-2014]
MLPYLPLLAPKCRYSSSRGQARATKSKRMLPCFPLLAPRRHYSSSRRQARAMKSKRMRRYPPLLPLPSCYRSSSRLTMATETRRIPWCRLAPPTKDRRRQGNGSVLRNMISWSPEKAAKVDRVFSAQLSSSAALDSFIEKYPAALEDIQRVIAASTARSIHPDDELSDMDGRRKLGALVTMSTALGEVALRHTEDMDVQRKELALPPFSKEYYSAVRSGLCQAYLAASVIDSDWVSTSKTGRMGKVGAAVG